jgi:phosphate transport system substrate-binding protein
MYADPMATLQAGQRARPILRLMDATDTALIKSISPAVAEGVEEAGKRRGMLSATTDSETADLIEKTPGGFGPSTLAQILSEKRPIVALTIDGVAPTVETLARGSYKLEKRLFVISRKDANAATQAFLAYLQSEPAKQLLAAHGHLMR